MKKNKKTDNKTCFILYTISASLFAFSGVMSLISDGLKNFNNITYIGLAITYGSLAYIYYKRYKDE